MVELKRSRFFHILFADQRSIDFQAFLEGQVRFSLDIRLQAFSALTEETTELTSADLELLGQVPSQRWIALADVAAFQVDLSLLEPLVTKGLLLSTAAEAHAKKLRGREERLEAVAWHPHAAFYHFQAKQPSVIGLHAGSAIVDIEAVASHSTESFDRFVAEHGPPPPAIHRRREAELPSSRTQLPRIEKSGGLYSCLEKRRTIRAFNTAKPLKLEDLAVILQYTFGVKGCARLSKDVQVLKRTSPSGGSLHPIEVYPLVINVAGLKPGFYHYDGGDHSLVALSMVETQDISDLAMRMAGNQSFAGEAHALLLMTARFERNFWKYRSNEKTYGVILVDSGHLSQTFYLVCAELGLGSFYSAAINAPLIDEVLGLDGIAESAIAVCGCGERSDRGPDHGLPFVSSQPKPKAE